MATTEETTESTTVTTTDSTTETTTQTTTKSDIKVRSYVGGGSSKGSIIYSDEITVEDDVDKKVIAGGTDSDSADNVPGGINNGKEIGSEIEDNIEDTSNNTDRPGNGINIYHIDDEGFIVDEDGNIVEDENIFVDENGNIVDNEGNVYGHADDNNGNSDNIGGVDAVDADEDTEGTIGDIGSRFGGDDAIGSGNIDSDSTRINSDKNDINSEGAKISSNKETTPKTGDTNNVFAAGIMLLMAMFAFLFASKKAKKVS